MCALHAIARMGCSLGWWESSSSDGMREQLGRTGGKVIIGILRRSN